MLPIPLCQDDFQNIRDCKHQMEIRGIKHILSASIHPHFLRNSLTHGTATVPAGIIMDMDSTTVFAYTDIRTISSCFAIQDVPGNFCLFRGWGTAFKVCRIKMPENILDGGFIHGRHLLSCQKGFECPSGICC